MKVYALILDYKGYEELVDKIFSTRALANLYLYNEFKDCGYTKDKKEWLYDSEYSLVEWELDTNKRKLLRIHI